MTINNKSERNYRGKCLGSPVTSYGGDLARNLKSLCNFFSPIKHVSLRKLAPSRNAVFNDQTGMDFVTELSFCKTPVVDEKRLVFRG